MAIPFAHSDPRFTTWSKSPSSEMSLPSRTDATMPHPHEQKLQEVVNSLTFVSFNFLAAAFTAVISRSPPSPNPTLPPTASFNHSLRLTPAKLGFPGSLSDWLLVSH